MRCMRTTLLQSMAYLRRHPLVAALVAVLALLGLARGFETEGGATSVLNTLSQPFEGALRVLALTSDSSGNQARRPGAGGAAGGPLPVVTVSQPAERDIVEWDDYTGRFDAVEFVEVRARVAGYLDGVHFKDGQLVRKGDLLFTIDPRPFERAVEQARAEVAQAQTKIDNSDLDVKRGQPLLDRKVLSQKTFDDRANLKREAEAALKVADAKLRTAELDLSFTRVVAPISGRMSRTLVTPGNFVNAGGAVTPTLLSSIVSQNPIYLYFDVSENNALKYKRLSLNQQPGGVSDNGAAVEIGLPDEKGWPHRGRVDFADNRLDAGTGTLRARAVVENADGLYSAGMFARVRVAASPSAKALLLPDEAIGSDQVNKFVLVVGADGSVERKVVTLGSQVSGLRSGLAGGDAQTSMRIVRSGVTAQDWVIVKGLQRSRPGQKVAPQREALKITDATAGPAPASAAP